MIFLVFLGLLGLYSACGDPLEEYYVGGNVPAPNRGFFYDYRLQPRSSVYFYPNEINRPVFHPQLGMSPRYHDLVYDYVKDFAGAEPPPHAPAVQPSVVPAAAQFPVAPPENAENFGEGLQDKVEQATAEEITDKPGLNDYFPPSDFFSLPNHPKSQFYGHMDAIKMRRMNPKVRPTSLPPLGGVISDYVLQRGQPHPQNVLRLPGSAKDNEADLQHIKRQIPDNSDGVVILAEPSQNSKMTEDNEPPKEEAEGNKEEEQPDAHPGIAQSKPSAIALAGPGGMAQASPVGTALVGQGGLAVAAPSGTAVAGPAGQGAIPIQIGSEKQKTTEKTEEADFY